MLQIDIEFLLARLPSPITPGRLRRGRAALERVLDNVYVDITHNSMLYAVEQYPCFTWDGEFVTRITDCNFDHDVPESIKDLAVEAMEGLAPPEVTVLAKKLHRLEKIEELYDERNELLMGMLKTFLQITSDLQKRIEILEAQR